MTDNISTEGAKVTLGNNKRAKIIATVGPSTNSYSVIFDLIKSGANGLRLNFSHGTHQEKAQQIEWIRKASKELGKPVAIIQDLQGPKIRLGDFEGAIELKKGDSIALVYGENETKSKHLPIQFDISKKVKRNERIYFFDGRVKGRISVVSNGVVHVIIENNGTLIKRKGINLPDTDFEGEIITAKDKADLVFGSTHDIDYVALSFAQSSKDVFKNEESSQEFRNERQNNYQI